MRLIMNTNVTCRKYGPAETRPAGSPATSMSFVLTNSLQDRWTAYCTYTVVTYTVPLRHGDSTEHCYDSQRSIQVASKRYVHTEEVIYLKLFGSLHKSLSPNSGRLEHMKKALE